MIRKQMRGEKCITVMSPCMMLVFDVTELMQLETITKTKFQKEILKKCPLESERFEWLLGGSSPENPKEEELGKIFMPPCKWSIHV